MGIPFAQGNAPMPEGCECDPMDFAALGHMTTCPCYVQTPKQNACRRCGGFNTILHRERYQAETTMVPCPDCTANQPVIATPEFRDHAGLPGGTFDYPDTGEKL